MGPFLGGRSQSVVEFNGMHALVLAGAGTGKTRTIVARTQHLIREGVEARRILLLTFTRRASKEMLSRLKIMVGPAASKIEHLLKAIKMTDQLICNQ